MIAFNSEPADLTFYNLPKHRHAAELLPRMNVRHVDFLYRNRKDCKCISNTATVVCPRTRIDRNARDLVGKTLVDAQAHIAFAVGLITFHLNAKN